MFFCRFDVILDSFGKKKTGYSMNCLKPYRNAKYVTIKHPFLKNFDNYGVPGGAVKSVVDAACDTIKVVYCLISSVSYLLHISGKILIANGKVILLIVMLDNHSVDQHVCYRACATFFLGPVFLAHLAFRPCELLPSLFIRRLSSVNISHFNLLLRNHWANCNQTLVEWSLDGRQAKNRKKGG